MNEIMSDEELSELAEALQDACQGKKVSASGHSADGYYCPLGALYNFNTCFPTKPRAISLMDKLPLVIGASFADGFDGTGIQPYTFIKAYELGCLFREMYP